MALYSDDVLNCPRDAFLEMSSRAGEFIVILGCARSGTTIIADVINQSPEAFVLYEDNPFLNAHRNDYSDWYNKMHIADGRQPAKGTYLPSFGSHNPTWSYVYANLKRTITRVGTKIALGPHGLWPDIDVTMLNFFSSLFFGARYVLTLRQPVDNILSMRRMFPDRSFTDLLDTWLLSLGYSITFAGLFPHTLLIRNELIAPVYLERLKEFTGLALPLDPELVAPRAVRKGLPSTDEISRLLEVFGTLSEAEIATLARATDLHAMLYSAYHKDTGLLRDAVHRVELARVGAARIAAARRLLSQPGAA